MEEFYRIRRLPPYVFEQINRAKAAARNAGADIIDLGMGNPDLPTPRHVIEKLKETLGKPKTDRYSASRGITGLRKAQAGYYARRFGVKLNPDTQVVATLGSKEGFANMAQAITAPGDVVLVPNPSYPIHIYGPVISGADIRHVPMTPEADFFEALERAFKDTYPKPKMLIVNFPSNPTTQCVELPFFERLVGLAREHHVYIVHDLAYADIVFDGYQAPSILQVPGAREIAVEFFTMSKSYNMAGWRVGYMVGNRELVTALARMKSYHDYGTFTPIQVASIIALEGPQDCVEAVRRVYQGRRDVLCSGMKAIGWNVEVPKATMYVWAPIPEPYRNLGSLEFSKKLLGDAKIAVAPGVGFGQYGDGHVRFALIENEARTRQALRGIKEMFRKDGLS
jgi:alanine-synthesizing transaminase